MENTLAIIEYESENEIIFLDKNAEKIFVSYRNQDAGKNTALAIINSGKQVEFTSRGMRIQVLEENPDMKNYVLLYHRLNNQGSKLAKLGKVYLLTENHSLVRINEGVVFLQTGEYAKFMSVPLQEINLQVTNTTLQKEASPSAFTPLLLFKSSTFLIITIIFAVVIVVVFSIILWKRLKKRET